MANPEKWYSLSFLVQAFLGFVVLAGFPYYTFKNNPLDILLTNWWIFIFLALWAVGWIFYGRWIFLTFKREKK